MVNIDPIRSFLSSAPEEFFKTLHPRTLQTCVKISTGLKEYPWLDRRGIDVLPILMNRSDKKTISVRQWIVLALYQGIVTIASISQRVTAIFKQVKPYPTSKEVFDLQPKTPKKSGSISSTESDSNSDDAPFEIHTSIGKAAPVVIDKSSPAWVQRGRGGRVNHGNRGVNPNLRRTRNIQPETLLEKNEVREKISNPFSILDSGSDSDQ